MTDIARLGFSAETSSLKDAKATLDALVPSAQKAAGAADRFNKAAAGGTGGIRAFGVAASGATGQVHLLGNGVDFLTGKVNMNFVAINKAIAGWNQAKTSLAGIPAAANGAASSLNRLGAAANDNINRLQSTPGNIAAQFQDIGVTAAGGMNPLLIALQQGTQLSAAMQGGVGNLIAGLRQLFNMTTILTVGMVALIAAGLQMVDWMRVAEVLVNGLADGLDGLAGFIERNSLALVYFGGVALIAFGPAILSSVLALAATIGGGLVTALTTATYAMISFSLANPFGAVLIAIGLVIAAMAALNDTFGGVFTRILKVVRTVANAIIGFFASAFNAVLEAAQTVVNGIITAFEGVAGFLGFDVSVGRVDLSGIKFDTRQGRDYVGDIGAGIGNAIGSAADFARGLLTPDAASVPAAARGGSAARGASGPTAAEREAEAYAQLVKRTNERVAALTDETMALGMTEAAGARFLAQQALLRDAASQNITVDAARRKELMALGEALASAQIDKAVAEQTRAYKEQMQALKDQSDLIGLTGRELVEAATFQDMLNDAVRSGAVDLRNMNEEMRQHILLLRKRAGNVADATVANQNAEFMANVQRDFKLQTAALRRQAGEIGLVGPALQAHRIESDLINRALRENIALTPQNLAQIRQQATEYANLSEEIRQQREQYELARQSLRGFFGDMVSGLQQGQSVWQAFGNAVMNVVNRIINRLLDLATDSVLGSLGKLLNPSRKSGSSLGGAVSTVGQKLPGILKAFGFADGGAFDGGVQKFAKGGAFTNGIYSTPTLFKFAKGGAFGQMGEAGPEAVMPLKRGPDGSLGVQVQASEPQMVTVRIVTDDERFDAYVDTRIGANAPSIAQAGAVVSERERKFNNSRRLA